MSLRYNSEKAQWRLVLLPCCRKRGISEKEMRNDYETRTDALYGCLHNASPLITFAHVVKDKEILEN